MKSAMRTRTAPLQRAAILLGSGDEVVREQVLECLGRRGLHVELAGSADEVRAAAARARPSLALLAFPDMAADAFGLCRELARRPAGEAHR